jgi:hypothetical protein
LYFAGEDKKYVVQISNLLQQSGVKVFYDNFYDTRRWGTALYIYLTEIYRGKELYTIMFISEHYAKKMWKTIEKKVMQARDYYKSSEYRLPARFDDIKIPNLLSTM